jgi:hypothetical protein
VRAVLVVAPALAVLLVSGCGGEGGPVGAVVGTRPALRDQVLECLRLLRGPSAVTGHAIERTGRSGRSITLRSGSRILGCDGVPASEGAFCASAVGLLRRGELVDPRLSLTCRVRGRTIGFGWMEPLRGARWIVVRVRGSAELYPVAGELPVRVTTTRVGLDSAVFDVAQYTGSWHELERRRLVLHVSG